MSIAEKLTTIAENQQKVYDAGFVAGQREGTPTQDNAQYASLIRFEKVAFPEGYEMQIKLDNVTQLPQFRHVTGIRKITLDVPLDKAYDATYMLYPNTSVEEVVFPDGIKINVCNMMATNCTSLVSVFGRIDFTGATSSDAFNGCTSLVDVSFVPLSITHSKNFHKCYDLSDASIQSIIDGLADLTGQTAQTLTLYETVGAKLTEAQKATIAAKNWTVNY